MPTLAPPAAGLTSQANGKQNAGLEGVIDPLIEQTATSLLKPYSLFVAWQGVLTLAYRHVHIWHGPRPPLQPAATRFSAHSSPARRRGFPPALTQLKQQLSDTYPALPRENPGSRWPKTSLAALKDNQRLSPEQLERLTVICK
jgi:hypothetical protein